MSNGQTQPTTTPSPATTSPPEEFERLLNKEHRPVGVFDNPKEFAHAQRVAKMLTLSKLMPEHFQGDENLGSAVIAVDIAFRLKLSPSLVAQQIYLVHGKPAFSAQFMIGVMNTSADFGKIRYDLGTNGEKEMRSGTFTVKLEDRVCVAWALEGDSKLPQGINTLAKAKEAGLPILEGPPVSMEMAIKEGWYNKSGSKWQTLPDLMLRYRAAAFFGRLYAPELMMGLPTVDELEDLGPSAPEFSRPVFGKPEPPMKEPEAPKPPSAAPPFFGSLYAQMVGRSTRPVFGKPEPPMKEPEAPKPPSAAPPSPAPATAAPPITPTPPPEAKTPPVATQALPEAGFNPLKALRGLCKEAGIKEQAVIDFLKEIGSIKDDSNSLEQIHLGNDKVIAMCCEQWSDIAKRLKG